MAARGSRSHRWPRQALLPAHWCQHRPHVHQRADRANAAAFETALHPCRRRRPGIHPFDDAATEARARARRIENDLAASVDGLELSPTTGLVSHLRQCKRPEELALIERAIAIQEQALEETLAQLEPGMTVAAGPSDLEAGAQARGGVTHSSGHIMHLPIASHTSRQHSHL